MQIGRICTDCKVDKLWDDFPKQARGLNGKSSICKLCRRVRARNWMFKNQKRYIQYCNLRKTFERKEPVCASCKQPTDLHWYTIDKHRALYHDICATQIHTEMRFIAPQRLRVLQDIASTF